MNSWDAVCHVDDPLMADDRQEPPSQVGALERLYQQTPDGSLLQMCFMRPDPSDLCPQLPLLLERSPRLPACTPRLSVLPAETVLSGCGAAPASADAAEAPSGLLHAAERALLHGAPLPAAALAASPAEWRDAIAGVDAPFGALELRHMASLASELRERGSEPLADLLLRHPFSVLLSACDADADDADAPLPAAHAALLSTLLERGSMLRLPAADFDVAVVRHLHDRTPLGPRAATHAALLKAAIDLRADGT